MDNLQVKRIYDDPESADGYRVLVDRLWPRGVSRDDAELDEWLKEIAPSDELREWFDHEADKWAEFRERYRGELAEKRDQCRELLDRCESDTLTLLYAAKDREHNNAVVLREFVEELGDGTSNK